MSQFAPQTDSFNPILHRAERRHARAHRVSVSLDEMERHIAARIRYRRVTLDLSLAEFAMLQGVTCEEARSFETCEGRVSAGRLAWIAATFRTDLSWFFEGLGSDNTRQGRTIEGETTLPDLIRAALRRLTRS